MLSPLHKQYPRCRRAQLMLFFYYGVCKITTEAFQLYNCISQELSVAKLESLKHSSDDGNQHLLSKRDLLLGAAKGSHALGKAIASGFQQYSQEGNNGQALPAHRCLFARFDLALYQQASVARTRVSSVRSWCWS